jgi:CubicO group peptidase (beta-lactamase class C family)
MNVFNLTRLVNLTRQVNLAKVSNHLLASFFLLILVACCNSSNGERDEYQYQQPLSLNDAMVTGTLAEHSVNQTLIEAMFTAIDNQEFTGIDSVLIMRDGVLVLDELLRTELGDHDRFIGNQDINTHSMQSVSKSFVSAVIGIAIDQGHINSTDDLMLSYFPEYAVVNNDDVRKRAWTIDDFLTMQTGLQWDEWTHPFSSPSNSLGSIYQTSNNYIETLFNLPMANEPGSTFAYSTIASVALGGLVENATGEPFEEYANKHLFEPLGMDSAIWAHTPTGRAHTGGGLWLSSRDMIKFGQLFLQNGTFNGERIISQEWINRSSQSRVLLTQYLLWEGYGYQWWIDNFRDNTNQLHGIYSANGNGGQFIFVWPEKNAVIVFTGQNYDSSKLYQPQQMMRQFIIPAME